MKTYVPLILVTMISLALVNPTAGQSEDLARYTPLWIRDGFATGGTTHEPWLFLVRKNSASRQLKKTLDHRISENYIKSLADAGVTVFHLHFYKGFGFEAEKPHMDEAARVIKIAHKYGLKADTYIQWNTMAYETFFAEVPQAESDKWYQIDESGKPLMLTYGFQQAFRFRPCFNHEDYIDYFKEKILRYAVEVADTDFIHFDNFDLNPPPDFCHNPATIEAFRHYLRKKYSPMQLRERFGFDDISHIRPPMWNQWNPPERLTALVDPAMQEWTDFRCWTMVSRLAECARFVRRLKKEVVIEVNPHGLLGDNRAWLRAINHPDLMQYTNVIWTEDRNNPRWEEGVAIGKFRHYKLGRTTGNFILTYNSTPQDWAENLALNRTIADLPSGVPQGEAKKHLDFWKTYKDLFTQADGAERVAILRSYPSMAYNNVATHNAVNMAEQVLQQRQIPFDIIFDQQIDQLNDYSVLVLANQESLSDGILDRVVSFVEDGGGLVATGDTGRYDHWRRLREVRGLESIFRWSLHDQEESGRWVRHGKGTAVFLPELTVPAGVDRNPRIWKMPENADELEAAVLAVSREPLPLQVDAPEWVGVSHDRQTGRDIIHLFNYRNQPVSGIVLRYRRSVKKGWSLSPHRKGSQSLSLQKSGEETLIQIPGIEAYEVVVLER